MKKIMIIALTTGFTFAQMGESVPTDINNGAAAEVQVIKIGSESAKKLRQALKDKLTGQILLNGGPAAIGYCNENALKLTADVAGVQKVSLKRTSMKIRNPQNSPDSDDIKALEYFDAYSKIGKPLPENFVKKMGDKKYYYYEPIVMTQVCLKCHGDINSMDKGVVATIKKLYPSDMATGYKAGELRGTMRVSVTLP